MRTTSLVRLGASAVQLLVVFGCTDAPVAPAAAPRLDVAAVASSTGGDVLPANEAPSGYTLADMVPLMAYFTTSGNKATYYPSTPFQILYVNYHTGTNKFTVAPGTFFFVPVINLDDSPPIIGSYPASPSGAASYVFSKSQVGAYDIRVVVDGRTTTLGPAYVAGPAYTPGLLDGGGEHYMQVGAFLSPLSLGTHTVTIGASFDGAAFVATFGGPFSFEFTYQVTVR